MLQPPRWVKHFTYYRSRQREANIDDIILRPEGIGQSCDEPDAFLGLTLLDLFVLHKVEVKEDEKRVGRYLVMLEKDSSWACEITSDAFETLAHTDLPEKRRSKLLKKREHSYGNMK
jgi:hypothetical protein